MSKTNTGGPAFPIPLQSGQSWQGMAPCDGMTLRDYFAAKASEEDINEHIWKGHTEDYVTTDGYGKKSVIQRQAMWTREEARYRYADAMLKAREA
jgi:hypothetical protein